MILIGIFFLCFFITSKHLATVSDYDSYKLHKMNSKYSCKHFVSEYDDTYFITDLSHLLVIEYYPSDKYYIIPKSSSELLNDLLYGRIHNIKINHKAVNDAINSGNLAKDSIHSCNLALACHEIGHQLFSDDIDIRNFEPLVDEIDISNLDLFVDYMDSLTLDEEKDDVQDGKSLQICSRYYSSAQTRHDTKGFKGFNKASTILYKTLREAKRGVVNHEYLYESI